jgi:pimeloyl-ACP methyl ester carboxylesterase
MTSLHTLNAGVLSGGPVMVHVTDQGEGRPFLLLHGGGGPQTVAGFAGLLASSKGARVLTPVHPGFGGTVRPDALASVGGLAALYVALLDELDLHDVTVIGNSVGGWIAAEMALLHSPRISAVVICDGTGIIVPGHPIADFFSLTLDQVSQLSYFDPDRFRIDPETLPPPVRAAMPGNRASLAAYAGSTFGDPALAGRLAAVSVPVLVLWGEADRIAGTGYGRAYAAAIPGAEFRLLTKTGHMPHLETPDQKLAAIWDFVTRAAAPGAVS